MIPKYSQELFEKAKSKDLLDVQCECCGNLFKTTKITIQMCLKGDKFRKAKFCSLKCSNENKIKNNQ